MCILFGVEHVKLAALSYSRRTHKWHFTNSVLCDITTDVTLNSIYELYFTQSLWSVLNLQGREFEVCGQFSDFMYWNLQSTPTADDKLIQAMTWSKLAQTVSTLH